MNLTEQTAFEADIPVATVEESLLPTSIYIKKLDRTIPVLNPDSRSVADLDAALLDGVVRHPDSAKLAQNGNVFILGHSSYLPTVLNKNFQAFNGIQNLAWGDTIEVSSGGKVHVFEVEKVFKAQASDLTVPIAGQERRLTLATCNSFGSTDDRFIVEAKEIEVRSL
jgi:LPXTG-site transpeptidase (sortase) family protein